MRCSRKYSSAGGGHTATVNFINSKTKQSGDGLSSILDYCMREDKTIHDGRQLVTGIDCVPQSAHTEMMNTKTRYKKTDGKMYYQLVQSFSPDEKITPETAHTVAVEFAREQFKGYEVVVGTHVDAEHILSHIVFNSVSFENGRKYHSGKDNIQRLRDASDELCLRYGLSVIRQNDDGQKKESVQKMSPREYRSAERGESWKMMLIVTIEECMKRARSKEEFIGLMRSRGYDVRWTDTRKYITYTTPEGMRCRDNKLHEDKFLKGAMEYEFALRKEITAGAEGYRSPEDGGERILFDSAEYDIERRNAGDAEWSDRSARFSDREYAAADRSGGPAGGGQDRESHEGSGADGWENERELFKQSLYGGRTDEGVYLQDDVPFSDTVGGGDNPRLGIGSLAAGLKHLSDDDSEDPEERRKRIEAEQNGEAIGVLLGTAAGLICALADDEDDPDEEELEENDNGISMTGI